MLILVLNCGSTSTKLAVYDGEQELHAKTISHDWEELSRLETMREKTEYRYKAVISFLEETGIAAEAFACVVSRGGMLPSLRSGAYCINERMAEYFEKPMMINANASVSGLIAFRFAQQMAIPAFIYDAVSVDELEDVARYSGVKGYERYSVHHALNTRARAIETAAEMGSTYDKCTFIVAHMGGGFSVNVHRHGRIVDIISAEEGSFSPERCGGLQGDTVFRLIEDLGTAEAKKLFHGTGGLVSYFGTTDVRKVLELAEGGDREARVVLEAMAYQTAKSIGALATAVNGEVDRIILTGSVAKSELITAQIINRVKFIAPVVVKPGDNEMKALAQGALRVMLGREVASCFEG